MVMPNRMLIVDEKLHRRVKTVAAREGKRLHETTKELLELALSDKKAREPKKLF